MRASHLIDIEAEEGMHKESDRNTPSMVPNSLSNETPSKIPGSLMLVLKENRSPGPKKEFGEDLTEFFIPKSGLRFSTSLELRTYQEASAETVQNKGAAKEMEQGNIWNVFSTAQQAKQEATEAEKNFDRDPSEANLIALNKSNAVMVQALTMEAEYWRQKSNCKWLEAGERNTKYFHSLVKKKRMKSTIHRIMEGNQEITHPDRIRDSAASYFENLLSGQGAQPSASDFPFQFPKISEAIGNNLCSIPSEEDIKETVFSIDKNSVAGPDGFSSSFYHACWDFIARDIYDAVRDFFSGTPMPRSFTATTIVLIPKVDFPQTWNDFRPISLCNVTNKILSKLLYRRISQALPE
ncbi:UNVERIFIED_CONTAM: LINE-1 reverse transcriptase [Sesamum radiatum]|uniref:LINE-1 reverse transcriptase n=1 Tax=Sesamum radiatum TaxID=300843 RepID=A0AAW2IIM7_SESRA